MKYGASWVKIVAQKFPDLIAFKEITPEHQKLSKWMMLHIITRLLSNISNSPIN